MKLSLSAIALCRLKINKGNLYGFEQVSESILDNLSEERIKQDLDDMIQNGLIVFSDDDIHISALGHHIFGMMSEPEQYVMLENIANKICIRIYIRNAYYLCIIEDWKESESRKSDRFVFELLPKMDLVIGSFVYALYYDEKLTLHESDINNGIEEKIVIRGNAWDKNRKEISEIIMRGHYLQDTIYYQKNETIDGCKGKTVEKDSDVSELINTLTEWLFDKISVFDESEM